MLLVGLAVLAIILQRQSASVQELRRQVAQLDKKLLEPTATPNKSSGTLDEQRKCAEQARKDFKDWGYTENRKLADFVSHYDSTADKCFMQIKYTYGSEPIWTERAVFDAFEGKVYARYVWHTEKDKKYWEVSPVHCEVSLGSGDKVQCHSETEFDDEIKRYMGTGEM